MTNAEIVNAFVNGADVGKANSMSISENRLFSYDTPIGYRLGDGRFIVNVIRWSKTTSTQINKLMSTLQNSGLTIVDSRQTTLPDQFGREHEILQHVYGTLPA